MAEEATDHFIRLIFLLIRLGRLETCGKILMKDDSLDAFLEQLSSILMPRNWAGGSYGQKRSDGSLLYTEHLELVEKPQKALKLHICSWKL